LWLHFGLFVYIFSLVWVWMLITAFYIGIMMFDPNLNPNCWFESNCFCLHTLNKAFMMSKKQTLNLRQVENNTIDIPLATLHGYSPSKTFAESFLRWRYNQLLSKATPMLLVQTVAFWRHPYAGGTDAADQSSHAVRLSKSGMLIMNYSTMTSNNVNTKKQQINATKRK